MLAALKNGGPLDQTHRKAGQLRTTITVTHLRVI
jgi:hypothetical protein